MATRSKTICRALGCKTLVPVSGYCEKHKSMASGWRRSHDLSSSAKRGYGAYWRKLRAAVLQRDLALCQICLKANRFTVATDVDHIIPKALGGTDDMDNLQSLCRACHKAKTISERGVG